jgi:hypothetical protein
MWFRAAQYSESLSSGQEKETETNEHEITITELTNRTRGTDLTNAFLEVIKIEKLNII